MSDEQNRIPNGPDQKPGDIVPGENNFLNILGFVKTVDKYPGEGDGSFLNKPKRISDQMVLVTADGSTSAYFYDTNNQSWHYVNLT